MSSSNKKYQIFISSTFTDLKDERNEVMKHILSLYHIPIGMEMFSANNAEQWETIKDTIDSSDYYILIIGHRYGSLDKDGLGYTEKEFNYAKNQGIPVLVFIRDRDAKIPDSKRDDPKKMKKLLAFIDSAKDNKLVAFWREKEDLALQVMLAFQKASSKNDRIGWIRADSIPDAHTVLAEMALLQKENREMRAELDGLRVLRSPNFNIVINDNKPVRLDMSANIWNSTDFITLNNPNFDKRHFKNMSTYNDAVKANQDIAESYNASKLQYLVRNSYRKLTILIENSGDIKATDINITLSIPDRLNALPGSRDAVIPFEFDKNLNFKMAQTLKTLEPSGSSSLVSLLNNVPLTYFPTGGYDITRQGNLIHVHINSLLHTKSINVSKLFLAAIDETFDDVIKFSLICEEITKPVEFEVPVSVNYIHNPDLPLIDPWV